MAATTEIAWTDATFNPWIGCQKVAAGCTHCYAESYAKRYGKAEWGPQGTRVKTSAAYWKQPIKWNREAERDGVRKRVFCASLADVFEDWSGTILCHDGEKDEGGKPTPVVAWWRESAGVIRPGQCKLLNSERCATMDDLRRDLFAMIDATPHLDWLLLTKRPENIRRMWPMRADLGAENFPTRVNLHPDYRDNAWLLTSAAEQKDYDTNAPHLWQCRDLVPVLGFSLEPLIGPINVWHDGFDWVIVGGESGHGARPMHPDWARSIRDQCQAAGVPFFFKQWGEWAPFATRARYDDGDMGGDCDGPGGLSHFKHKDGVTTCIARWGDGTERRCQLISPDGHEWGRDNGCRQDYVRVGKKAAGRLLDGREWSEFPSTLTGATR